MLLVMDAEFREDKDIQPAQLNNLFECKSMTHRKIGTRISLICVALACCSVFLAGCQATSRDASLSQLPEYVEDFRNPQFVNNPVVIVQTCLRESKINARMQDIAIPSQPMPLTVCKRRESMGQPCPTAWQTSEPADADTSFSPVRKVRVWDASGTAVNLVRSFIAIRDVRRGNLANSSGSGHSYLKDTTTEAQPVFEHAYEGHSAATLFAWAVLLESVRNDAQQPVYFWFKPSSGLRLNEFTEWRAADAEEIAGTGRLYGAAMANNADFPRNSVGPGSPYVRFGLQSYRQYHDDQRLYRHESGPAQLEIAKRLTTDQREGIQILRSGGKPIPRC